MVRTQKTNNKFKTNGSRCKAKKRDVECAKCESNKHREEYCNITLIENKC